MTKKTNESAADSSAATVTNQTTNQPGALGFPSSPPLVTLPTALPCREITAQEMQQRRHGQFNMPIEPSLYLWASREMSDLECLHLVCDAISRNEETLCRQALIDAGKEEWLASENLVVISIAKGIASRTTYVSPTDVIEFRALPGLLGKKKITIRNALDDTSIVLYLARIELAQTASQMKDRVAALELAEALVIAEEVAARAGHDTDKGDTDCGHWSPVVLLAHRLLKEALLADSGGAR